MRTARLTISTNRLLCMESHNHDSAGWRLGKVAEGITLTAIRATARAIPEPTPDDQHRCKSRCTYLAEQLRAAGLLESQIIAWAEGR